MEEIKDHLRDISEIRSMMEQNSKFLSLSGLSGISAGLCGLAGAFVAWLYLGKSIDFLHPAIRRSWQEDLLFFAATASIVMVSAVGLATFFSVRLARSKNLPIWNASAKHLLINMLIPLAAGGMFCLIQMYHGSIGWIPSTMLLFYGMALLNASKFTFPEIRWLAISEIVLGLLCAIWIGHGLIFWAIGFGLMHILYGALMYYKYEQ